MTIALPRNVEARTLKAGMGFYWVAPAYWRRQAANRGVAFPFDTVTLGRDMAADALERAAEPLNASFDEWRASLVTGDDAGQRRYAAFGSVDWVFETFLSSDYRKRKISDRSLPDYQRLFRQIGELSTTDGRTFGQLPAKSVGPAAAEKIYHRMIEGDRFRRGEKAVTYCKTAWRVVARYYPDQFNPGEHWNPWAGVATVKRERTTKAFATREQVYQFADAAIADGRPEWAAAAVICFEWLQRPENVIAGYFRWTDLQGDWVRIEHHKTGATILHPLRETGPDGGVMDFYPDAEAVLAQVPRRGIPIVIGPQSQIYQPARAAQLVRRIADRAGLPKSFTLDACRHGGMTELEEAQLTEGQGRALSGHKTASAYRGYAKRTQERALAATRRRVAYRTGEMQ